MTERRRVVRFNSTKPVRCDCEHAGCPMHAQPGACPAQAQFLVTAYGHTYRSCRPCLVETAKPAHDHTADEDCIVEGDMCIVCHVGWGDEGSECYACGGNAFHKPGCPEMGL